MQLIERPSKGGDAGRARHRDWKRVLPYPPCIWCPVAHEVQWARSGIWLVGPWPSTTFIPECDEAGP